MAMTRARRGFGELRLSPSEVRLAGTTGAARRERDSSARAAGLCGAALLLISARRGLEVDAEYGRVKIWDCRLGG
jgi:hypothetical protein